MNTRYYMVIIKGEIKTSEIMSCVYNRNTQKWDVKFNTGKTYSYAYLNVEKLTEPDVLNPNMYRISRDGREFFDVNAIYVFRSGRESYWHICFGDGSERDYRRNDLHIIESCLAQSQSSNVFEYIKQIAVCITKISTFLILCDLAVCLATLYVSFSLVFALMRYLQGKVFLIRFYSPTTLSSSRAEFRLPSRLACA